MIWCSRFYLVIQQASCVALSSRLSDNKSSSVSVFFTTNIDLIFRGVVSSRINWLAL